MTYTIWPCDCRIAMSLMDADSIDSVVCDPPYGLSREPDMAEVMRHWLAGDDYTHGGSGFMGKSWDSFVPGPAVWREAYRVLKPGGHLVAFFGTRTYDLGVLALRLAGFEVRDQLAWVFGSGFPKSHDVSKGIDKALGAERAVIGSRDRRSAHDGANRSSDGDVGDSQCAGRPSTVNITAPATPEAAQWQGWGTALKPAYEPIVLCRKPLSEPTVAANVLRWGTGAVNVDGCRVGDSGGGTHCGNRDPNGKCLGHKNAGRSTSGETFHGPDSSGGRWPANLAHDGSPEVTDGLGEAARFFYCAKASKADRNRGLEDHPEQPSAASEFRPNHTAGAAAGENGNPYGRWSPVRNTHPTVKPTALMQWLVRLVTPPGGTVLDPFMGSGSTGVAAVLEGFDFIGCEMTDEYVPIATARIDNAVNARYTSEP